MPRIAICGPKGAGKSTLADLIRGIDPRHQIIAFADPLKDQAADILEEARRRFGIPGPTITRALTEEQRARFGPFWQWYGTEFVRTAEPHYWTRAWASRVGGLAHVITPDYRFPNEAAVATAYGFLLVRVTGPDRRDADLRPTTHESEQHWRTLPADVEVENTGTLDALRLAAEAVIRCAQAASREAATAL